MFNNNLTTIKFAGSEMSEEERPNPQSGKDAGGDDHEAHNQLGRTWTARYTQPIKYRRYTDLDSSGRKTIMFKFDLPPGQTQLADRVYAVLSEHKLLGNSPTGLKFNRDKVHGRVWKLTDSPVGRLVADSIDQKLLLLADKMQREMGK
jgi:hypothetical protein